MSLAEPLVWCLRSSFKNSKPWRIVEAALKSPSIPRYSKGGKFSKTLTALWKTLEKRGRGDFGRSEGRICREFLGQNSTERLTRDTNLPMSEPRDQSFPT